MTRKAGVNIGYIGGLIFASLAFLLIGIFFCRFGLTSLFALILTFDQDYNPPATEMAEYFQLHEDDFAAAVPLLLEQENCQHTCTSTPEEITVWAGPDAKLYLCGDKEAPPMYDIETKGGTFTYIPDQEDIPESWNPCTGVRATCSYMFAPGWFRCKRTFD